jgi:hypothetical protein
VQEERQWKGWLSHVALTPSWQGQFCDRPRVPHISACV